MSGTKPIAFFGLQVPAGDEPTPVMSQVPMVGTIRITMAAIDPSAKPLEKDQPNRATLKIMRRPLDFDDYLGDGYEDESDEESDEEEQETPKANGKLSKADKALKKAQEKAEKMEIDAQEDSDEDSDSDDGDFEIEEFVVCTLDPERNYQQTLEFTVDEDEEVFFRVVGNYDVYLTGNYVVPNDAHDHDHDHDEDSDEDSEDEDDYDLSPTDSEIEGMMGESDSEEDDFDDMDDPRITEIDSEEEKAEKKKDEKKNLKRPAEEPAKSEQPEKLSKKQLKKLKANDGKAVDTTADTPDKKKVQFAKELEQGPTGTADKPKTKAEKKAEKKAADQKKAAEKPEQKPSNIRTVQGIKIEDKKEGTGAVAKNGSRLGMRYIGKLKNGKQFDANTKGKPFSFRLGKGEVIKGWDLGLVGMKVGGERRLEIPANMAYGNKSLPGIPGNSTLIFDVKLVEVK
ncbi:hypothetical protein EX30DRAFT_343008 [Ascodesmis nigricans]|uniref:FK506-binding protein n=1 Tax=Ascodesmis nigricans TaxID=341454 RepID=A0A4S2MNF8_9PEZI|nr:hypothetical protein EX30DRAFT_343008 [Ascodesmis nigricans]